MTKQRLLLAYIMSALIFALGIVAGYHVGRKDGIRHAIEDSEIYATERYDPDRPEASEWNGYDLRVYIEIDGKTYEHGVYQS